MGLLGIIAYTYLPGDTIIVIWRHLLNGTWTIAWYKVIFT